MLLSSSFPQSDVPPRKRSRPKGLWKGARAKLSADWVRGNNHHSYLDPNHHHLEESDEDARSEASTTTSSKRRRIFYSESDDEEDYFSFFRERSSTPPPETPSVPHFQPPRNSTRRFRLMDTTTTARCGAQTQARKTCDYEDWEDLKDLFAKAAEAYEEAEPSESLPLLRAVIHECHRFLLIYHDPSVLFTSCMRRNTTQSLAPSHDRKDWICEDELNLPAPPLACAKYNCCIEIPTAFHAIMGSALFLFGNIVAQDPSLVLDGEPDTAAPYWLAALDVFETGENLPSRTNGHNCCNAPEDWRMAIVWGRALVCLADETLSRCAKGADLFAGDDPAWPKDSPFATIASRRPPLTRRMTLSSATADDLMMLAMDQFSRGIFHMPHTKAHPPVPSGTPIARPQVESFSRAKELFTIASEVLSVSERMEKPSERSYWALWADSVFNQMKMEADMDAWRIPIIKSRARCQLIVGTARAEELEEALERGETGVLTSEEALEARESLEKCVEFFERVKMCKDEPFEEGLKPLYAEALLTLANLTVDETKREELYARAEAEGFALDVSMDESS